MFKNSRIYPKLIVKSTKTLNFRQIHYPSKPEKRQKKPDLDTYFFPISLQGRKRAEDLNERVMIWSVFVTIAIFCAVMGQVCVLKSWFSEKKPSQLYSYNWRNCCETFVPGVVVLSKGKDKDKSLIQLLEDILFCLEWPRHVLMFKL